MPTSAPARAHPDRQAPLDRARRVMESALRLSAAYIRVLQEMRPRVAAATLPVAGGLAVYAGIGSPLTQAFGLGLGGPVLDADLARLEGFYLSRGVPVQIELSTLADPTLKALLERRGYQAGHCTLALERALPGPVPPAAGSSSIRVHPAESDQFAQWIAVVARGFIEDSLRPLIVAETYEIFRHMPEVRCYLATIGGAPAGGAALACEGGIAHLFGASTLPSFRRRGVHAALLRGRLASAVTAGCTVASLGARPDAPACRNARRAGFEEVTVHTTMTLDPRGGAEILLHY